jgi:hypothetical protein
MTSIDELLAIRNEIIEIFAVGCAFRPDTEMMEPIHRFFEQLLDFFQPPENVNQWNEDQFDNIRFFFHELFLYWVGILLKLELFSLANFAIENDYYFVDRFTQQNMHIYSDFNYYPRTIIKVNDNSPSKKLSLRASMLNDRSKHSGVDFKYLMAADFILWFRSRELARWWHPDTLVDRI